MKILSTITGWLRAWKRRAWDDRIDAAAARLFLRMMVIHEEQEDRKRLADLEEKKQLADAWMPFDPRKLTKSQAKILTFIDEDMMRALEVVGEEIRAELSNRVTLADGTPRDRAMYALVGVKMYIDTLKQKIAHYGGQQKREKAKKKAEREKAPKEQKRTMADLYGNDLMKT